jgi:hypothetical protein
MFVGNMVRGVRARFRPYIAGVFSKTSPRHAFLQDASRGPTEPAECSSRPGGFFFAAVLAP